VEKEYPALREKKKRGSPSLREKGVSSKKEGRKGGGGEFLPLVGREKKHTQRDNSNQRGRMKTQKVGRIF